MTDHTTPEPLVPSPRRIRTTASLLLGLFAVYCLLLFVLVPLLCGRDKPTAALGLGVILSVLAIPFHILGSKKRGPTRYTRPMFYILAMLLNTLGIALSQSAYYTHIKATDLAPSLIPGLLLPLGLAALLCLVLLILPRRYAGLTMAGGIITLLAAIIAVILWIVADPLPDRILWSFLFFTLLALGATIVATYAAMEDDEPSAQGRLPCLRYLSFASFGLFLAVAAIVLLILMCAGGDCDCDCCDGCDCGDCSSGAKSKKSKKRV